MKTVRKALPVIAAALLIATLAPVSAQGDDITLDANNDEGTPGVEQTGDVSHVANIPWTSRGSDLEFASQEVVKLSGGATGDPVCVEDPAQPDGCARDANGEIVFQTEVRDFAIAGVYSEGAKIVDVTDPENPVLVAESPCRATQNDIQVRGDILLQAQDSGSGQCTTPEGSTQPFQGTAVLDFSDPRDPVFVSRLQYSRGSHNHTLHPTEPLVYLSDSDVLSTTGNIPIWDISDPANPQLVTQLQHLVHSPHDITFNADGTRAYVAAVSASYILNTEDPRDPQLVTTIANEGISISHQADPTPDGNYLLVSDELGGGAAGVPPGGPVHVYDIHDEEAPVKIGVIENNCLPEDCQTAADDGTPISTAHVFRINPDGWTMAIGWYKDGMFVIDYSSLIGGNVGPSGETVAAGARVIAGMKMPGANTWTAKMWQERHPGYVFANGVRGLDVFFVPDLADDFLAYGHLKASNPTNFQVDVGVTRQDFEDGCDYAPRTQGVDGWVQEIPAELADGTSQITAGAESVSAVWDLDMWFYDENCTLIGSATEDTFAEAETADIPAGAKYVLVANFWPVEHGMRIRLDAS